eukprot:m.48933 g.48933  ORF g.48933 m.48933 type:complete len:256 (+) comp13334_c0_seq1:65-832(+)
MDCAPITGSPAFEASSKTLIVPSLSIGSVSQLAADLLIESLSLKPCLTLDHDALVPVVGNMRQAADSTTTLVTAAQVYSSPDSPLAVLQQRSSLISTLRDQYRNDLVAWVKEQGYQRVLLLAGTDASERIDNQLQGVQLRWVLLDDSPSGWDDALAQCSALGLPALERRSTSESNPEGVYLPSSGMARSFLHQAKAVALPTAALVMFVNEGDNVQSSITLTSAVLQLLNIPFEGQLQAPSAWALLYGTGIRPALF